MDRKETNTEYKLLHQALEYEFFVIVNKGTPTQHRKLRKGKTRAEFDIKHNELGRAFPQSPEPPLVFEPPLGTGIPEKVEYIEQFLRERYKEETE